MKRFKYFTVTSISLVLLYFMSIAIILDHNTDKVYKSVIIVNLILILMKQLELHKLKNNQQ